MSERKTLCDLGMVTVDFSGSDPGSTFQTHFSPSQRTANRVHRRGSSGG